VHLPCNGDGAYDRKYNTHRITDGAAIVGRRGGPEGSDGCR